MAVDTPQISIDPYRSQVPLVQIPQQDLQGPPPQGAIYSKTGGIATIADGAMKGLLKGLQMKEEKKYKTAEAVMNAQDAGISAAKKNYEDLLTTEGAWTVSSDGVAKTPNLKTQAAYAAWQTAVNAAAAQRQAFAVPEKTAKPKKGEKKDKTAADGAPAAPGFGGALKQFFERNPHVLPELTITAWKAGQNTPYGQMSPEALQAQRQNTSAQRQDATEQIQLQGAQRTANAQKVYDQYSGLSAEELAKLPRETQQAFQAAKNVLVPIPRASSTEREYTSPDGKQREWYIPGTEPQGWNATANPSSGTLKVGTEPEFTSQALKGYGYTADTAPPALLKYLHDSWAYKAAQTTSGTSEHMETDPKTGELVAVKTGSSTTRGAAAPKPPAGFSPLGENGLPQESAAAKPAGDTASSAATPKTGKMSKPPAAPGAGKGTMTAAPLPPGVRDTGIKSLAGVQFDVHSEESTAKSYDTATQAYNNQINKNRSKAADAKSLEALNATAREDYEKAKARIIMSRAAHIKTTGGDPWKVVKHGGKDVQFSQGPDGVYGTMDGINWVNINTGMPYSGQQ